MTARQRLQVDTERYGLAPDEGAARIVGQLETSNGVADMSAYNRVTCAMRLATPRAAPNSKPTTDGRSVAARRPIMVSPARAPKNELAACPSTTVLPVKANGKRGRFELEAFRR